MSQEGSTYTLFTLHPPPKRRGGEEIGVGRRECDCVCDYVLFPRTSSSPPPTSSGGLFIYLEGVVPQSGSGGGTKRRRQTPFCLPSGAPRARHHGTAARSCYPSLRTYRRRRAVYFAVRRVAEPLFSSPFALRAPVPPKYIAFPMEKKIIVSTKCRNLGAMCVTAVGTCVGNKCARTRTHTHNHTYTQ